MKTRIIRFAAAGVTALGFLAPGVASAHGGSYIDTTGPTSRNEIRSNTDNRVEIRNQNVQIAKSGYADVRDNRYVGNVTTGDAANYNTTRATVNIETSNSLPSPEGVTTANNTRPHSENPARNDIRFTTNNHINIYNDNYQSATSGDATVHNNTRVGDVRTGDAVNDNYTEFQVNVETHNN